MLQSPDKTLILMTQSESTCLTNSHLHSRITQLKAKAIKLGLIISCDRNDWPGSEDNYLILKSGHTEYTEHTTVATAVILLHLTNSVVDDKDDNDDNDDIK